ncbi:hypothetical protein GGI19_006642, partial [Coemansia pectinata]
MSIVHYVTFSSRLHFDRPGDKHLQIPLLWVCHNFRAHVHSNFCQDYGMTLNTVEDRVDIKRHSCPAQLEKIDYGTSSLVKELQICVDAWSVYSGAAYRLLSDEPRESLLFPLVRKLSVTFFTSCESNDDVTPEIEVNISAFICRVEEMAPGVNHVAFAAIKEGTLYSHTHLNPLVRLDYLETLFASQLFGLVETTYLNRMTRFLVDCPGLAPI